MEPDSSWRCTLRGQETMVTASKIIAHSESWPKILFLEIWKLTGQNPEHPYQILKLDLVWEDMWTRWLSEVSHDTNSTLTAYQKKLLNYSQVIWHNTEVWFYFSLKKVMCIINRLITASSCLISLSAEDKRFFFANKQSYILKAVTLIWNPVKFAELVRKKNLYCCFGVFREKDVHGLSKSTNSVRLWIILEWKWMWN